MDGRHRVTGLKAGAVLLAIAFSGCTLANDVDSLHFPDGHTSDVITDLPDTVDTSTTDTNDAVDIVDVIDDARDLPGIELPGDLPGEIDVTDDADITDARDDADIVTGTLGSPCESDDNCPEELFCYFKESTGFCTTKCLSTCQGADCCPAGYYCGEPGELPSVEEDELVCFKNEYIPCRPCYEDGDCKVTGATCADLGGEGFFCALPCGEDDTCDIGYKCDKSGGTGRCLPENDVCECPPFAATLNASTSCFNSSFFGTCNGARHCAVDGLTACDATAPTAEKCDNIDNNCNGTTDEEGAGDCIDYWTDVDKDLFGTGDSRCLCAADETYRATVDGDCNDNNIDINPGKEEVCGGSDENCDGATDEEGARSCITWYADVDRDEWGDSTSYKCLCDAAEPYDATVGGDCDDTRDWVNPFQAADPVDAQFVDQDCDGVDGQKEIAIFVSAAFGNDANDGTEARPKKTIQAAVNAAAHQPVFVAAGTYDEAIQIRGEVSVYGKFVAVKSDGDNVKFTDRDPAATTIIRNRQLNSFAGLSHSVVTVYGNTIDKDTEWADLTVVSEWPGTNPDNYPAVNTIAVFVEGASTKLQLSRMILTSGPGGTGSTGQAGSQGNGGMSGKHGSPAIETTDTNASTTGGAGGIGPCDSRSGGQGGTSQYAQVGTDGISGVVVGSGGGYGGYGGAASGDDCVAGQPGEDGQAGSTGSVGTPGTAVVNVVGTIADAQWVGTDGNKGGTGKSGHGGGGGGAGGSSICGILGYVGGSGGGGGGGGCGGIGGNGGASGGGAFGLWVKDAGPKLDMCEINVTGGGPGGKGGNGGQGGNGGSIGMGGTGSGLAQPAPAGGNGGKGGPGGYGGGGSGGAGGVSYGIYMVNPSDTHAVVTGTNFNIGNGGTGGKGGESLTGIFAPSGPQGASSNTNF